MINYLDIKTAASIRDAAHDQNAPLRREEIDAYTARKLREQLKYAAVKSDFYRDLFAGRDIDIDKICSDELSDAQFMNEFEKLPPTDQEDIKERDKDFLCVSAAEISRVVTMKTSGSTGKPKRIYFTAKDQKLTEDYFDYGMRLLTDSDDVVLILMQADAPGSIGDLLAKGISSFGARPVKYGLPKSVNREAPDILKIMKNEGVTSVVALPTHMIKLAREAEKAGMTDYDSENFIQLRSILLSGEYVPEETVMMLEDIFGCCIYEHYGMTEMGLGCAVSCGFGNGYHVREDDLYLEIVNPRTGEVIRDGSYGEIVFTTLTREGMPLIRYRTGDYSRWINEPCMCGSVLKRLDKVGSREHVKGILIDKIQGKR